MADSPRQHGLFSNTSYDVLMKLFNASAASVNELVNVEFYEMNESKTTMLGLSIHAVVHVFKAGVSVAVEIGKCDNTLIVRCKILCPMVRFLIGLESSCHQSLMDDDACGARGALARRVL